ncbi:MAG: hypothetical protein MUC87_22185 [Bacteroidia bacterium]|jgi:hypothetical protein|nr:hypothetical protein [Bacteroidia bacterium]
MLRGGTLFYALGIAVVLALMSGGLLLTAHFERLSLLHDQRSDAVIRNTASGLELLMGTQRLVPYDTPTEIDLFGNGRDSVRLTLRRWGLFGVALSQAHNGTLTHRTAALTGFGAVANDNTALRLADLERPLGICGNTILRGDCYLPTGGIRRTYVEGQNFTGQRDVYGLEKKATRMLPEPDKALVQRIDSLLAGKFQSTDSLLTFAELSDADSLTHSFYASPAIVKSTGALVLSNKSVSGNICFYSSVRIKVEATAQLTNVLLVAPYIEIANEVKGSFQAFARDSLRTGKKVELAYPSVLGIITTKQSPEQTRMQIGEENKIAGLVFGIQTVPDFRRTLLIAIDNKTELTGRLWCNDLVDLKGSVFGDVSCKMFRLQTPSAVYENQLLNAVIDRSKLPAAFVQPALVSESATPKQIAQWLN